MKIPKRIAIFMTNLQMKFEFQFLSGVQKYANLLGYDILWLTSPENHIDFLSNAKYIYSLIDSLQIDGALVATDKFPDKQMSVMIEQKLKERNIPSLSVFADNSIFPICKTNDRDCFCKITEHLITVHGYKKIHCLTGTKGAEVAERRLLGFFDAMKKHGLEVTENDYTYGDFWYDAAWLLAKRIKNGEIEKPEAVCCANDISACQLFLAFQEYGFRVPDDIAVTGIDGDPALNFFQPSITSIQNLEFVYGAEVFQKLHCMISGEDESTIRPEEIIIKTGESCGCGIDHDSVVEQDWRGFDKLSYNPYPAYISLASKLNNASTLSEAQEILKEYDTMFAKMKGFCVTLSKNFLDSMHIEHNLNDGQVKPIILKCDDEYHTQCDPISEADITPNLSIPHEPKIFIIHALSNIEKHFGYITTEYLCTDEIQFDRDHYLYNSAINNTLERLQINAQMQYINSELEKASERDFFTGLYNRKGFLKNLMQRQIKTDSKNCIVTAFLLENLSLIKNEFSKADAENCIMSFTDALNVECSFKLISARIGEDLFITYGPMDQEEKLRICHNIKENVNAQLEYRKLRYKLNIVSFDTDVKATDDINAIEAALTKLEAMVAQHMNSPKQKLHRYQDELENLRRRIYAEPALDWSAESISALIGLSTSRFQHLYKEQFETTILADVITSRITLAKNLLRHSDLSINEIAEKCGYSNFTHFMKIFKKKTGITATEYRKKNK
ncbi:MAG: substrate-binding domain-containing protein [Oscillospiraceae bacterium]|nr:substrate-binding domain-containing protein [Oscillospiraceae bacterium]